MTYNEAQKLCEIIPESVYTRNTGMGNTKSDYFANKLRENFPKFNWRIILDRSGEYTRWTLTVDNNDKREHFIPKYGHCVHCGKTAIELGVSEREED